MDLNLGAAQLRGRTARWTVAEVSIIAVLCTLGFWLRVHALAAEGFGDDEIHKWLAANRYLHGDFGGDDLEHPMVMKALIAFCIAVLPKSIAPETLTRLPNVVAATAMIWAVAQLGRRLYGKPAALIAAAICALSAMAVGYSRIAKEDVLLTLFLTLMFWCLAEAHAAAEDHLDGQRARWEIAGAVCLGAAFASKYFVFIVLLVLGAYGWVRRGSGWRVPLRRWVLLAAIGLATMIALDWVVLRPSTLEYIRDYLSGAHLADRAQSESYLFMGKLYDNLAFHLRGASPPYFLIVFGLVKFSPVTAVLLTLGTVIGLVRRTPADRLALSWAVFPVTMSTVIGPKYGRYFIDMIPPCVLLAGMAATWLASRLHSTRVKTLALVGCGLLVSGNEAWAVVMHEPHPRLYVNALAGGDKNVDWFFPHCDYFDAGVREAIQRIAALAEPNAEIASETRWLVRYYADRFGRHDLLDTSFANGRACIQGRICYVIVQNGRHYWHNQAAIAELAPQKPWSTVEVGGHDSVQIYRLAPGAPLFPSTPIAAPP